MYTTISTFRTSVLVILCVQCVRNSNVKEIPICGNRTEVNLAADGYESARIINFRPSSEFEFCALTIRAPPTHVIHVQILEDASRIKFKLQRAALSCNLHIFLEDMMKPVWHADLCTSDAVKAPELLSPKVTMRWETAHDKLQTKSRRLFVTAVGHGEYCKRPNQHICMKIGLEPLFCVSADVTCDGHEHCPSGSKASDEGSFCEVTRAQLWTNRIMRVVNQQPGGGASLRKAAGADNATDLPMMINDIGRTLDKIKRLTKIETTTKPAPDSRTFGSLHDLLSPYDPWGYLCLGVVLCGALFLMCYGVWECCIRRYKTDASAAPAPPTTVLIVNNYDEGAPQSQPPNFDELDLPPSYTALFPNKQPDERGAEVIAMDSINHNQAAPAHTNQ